MTIGGIEADFRKDMFVRKPADLAARAAELLRQEGVPLLRRRGLGQLRVDVALAKPAKVCKSLLIFKRFVLSCTAL